jgi:hypothetical protein
MVVGLEMFRDRFAAYADHYVLIGGVACSLALEDAGAQFRVTSDLDIVLCAEAQSPEFVAAFWKFVKDGDYEVQQKGDKSSFASRSPRQRDTRANWSCSHVCQTRLNMKAPVLLLPCRLTRM